MEHKYKSVKNPSDEMVSKLLNDEYTLHSITTIIMPSGISNSAYKADLVYHFIKFKYCSLTTEIYGTLLESNDKDNLNNLDLNKEL